MVRRILRAIVFALASLVAGSAGAAPTSRKFEFRTVTASFTCR